MALYIYTEFQIFNYIWKCLKKYDRWTTCELLHDDLHSQQISLYKWECSNKQEWKDVLQFRVYIFSKCILYNFTYFTGSDIYVLLI